MMELYHNTENYSIINFKNMLNFVTQRCIIDYKNETKNKRVVAMLKKIMVPVMVSSLILLAGCGENNDSAKEKSDVSPVMSAEASEAAAESSAVIYDYSSIPELTPDALRKMNEDNTEFFVESDARGVVKLIDGTISEKPVMDSEDAMDVIVSLRGLFKVSDPKNSFVLKENRSDKYTKHFIFNQYYKGVRVYGTVTNLTVNANTNIAEYMTSYTLSDEQLEKTDMEIAYTEKDILEKYAKQNVREPELVIYSNPNNKNTDDSPVLVYHLVSDTEYLLVSAKTGSITDKWPSVID